MKQAVLAFAGLVLLLARTSARSADLDGLRAAHEQFIKALNSHDVVAIVGLVHERAVGFGPTDAFATDYAQGGKSAIRRVWQDFFASIESWNVRLINPQYRVIGATGIVWGHNEILNKATDGPQRKIKCRFTTAYTKSDRKWVRVASHWSAIPPPN
jgi:ketosteroid isomerase-like protein